MKAKHLRSTTLPFPTYQSEGAVGLDLYADFSGFRFDAIDIAPGCHASIPTNLAVEIPGGYEGQIRGRSGLAFKYGVIGHLGTIDSDYRGELKVLLFNFSDDAYPVVHGDRVGQLVIAPVVRVELEEGEFTETARGENGFGSTGTGTPIDSLWISCDADGCGRADRFVGPTRREKAIAVGWTRRRTRVGPVEVGSDFCPVCSAGVTT